MSFYKEFEEYFTAHPFEVHMAPSEAPVVEFDFDVMPHEIKRVVHLVNEIAKNSPLGKSVLEEAAKAGYKLQLKSMPNAKGFTSPSNKAIALNSQFSEKALISTLVHECRHASQFEKGYTCEFEQYTFKTGVMLSKCMEADAQAVAAGTCLEYAGSTGSKAPLNAMSMNAEKVVSNVSAFVQKGQKIADENVLKAAFDGWYENPSIVRAYEKQYQINPILRQKNGEKMGSYSKAISSKEIVSALCTDSRGVCYWNSNLNVLEKESKLTVGSDVVETAKEFFEQKTKETGTKYDDSYKTLPTKEVPQSKKTGFRPTIVPSGNVFCLRKSKER